jgi:hypothetical protein
MMQRSRAQDRPRLARDQHGASLERFEIDTARFGVLCERSERCAVRLSGGHDDSRRLRRHGQQSGVVDLRSDVPLRMEERAAAGGDHEPISGLQRQRRIQLQRLTAPFYALHR